MVQNIHSACQSTVSSPCRDAAPTTKRCAFALGQAMHAISCQNFHGPCPIETGVEFRLKLPNATLCIGLLRGIYSLVFSTNRLIYIISTTNQLSSRHCWNNNNNNNIEPPKHLQRNKANPRTESATCSLRLLSFALLKILKGDDAPSPALRRSSSLPVALQT